MINYGFPGMMNPYMQMTQPGQATRTEIVRVNGRAGAETLQLAPNSTMLALDESAPVVWLVQTDGAGYKTATAYKIEHVKNEDERKDESLMRLEERIKRLEERIRDESDFEGAHAGEPVDQPGSGNKTFFKRSGS